MSFWLFLFLALLAFLGFFYHAQTKQGTRMFYSFAVCVIWLALASYFK